MKKSTILLLVLVYLASFLIVGIFGISVKSYDPTYNVEKVNIEVAANQVEGVSPEVTKFKSVENEDRHYTCVVRYNYVERSLDGKINCVVRLKASVYPTNATVKTLRLQTAEYSDVAEVIQEDNVYFNISFKIKDAYTFDIYATDGYQAYTTVKLMYNFES